ncbi:MAG TPA: YggS family pyridoxal phosphate-dependent enzyme [candidate division Zixibacteria bacterium]|nr:YggS family pyridoxal phosphate-dependent enzyme [candidate division Zixibacteria bacterium]HBZ01863.1 YggS family pyridoxal phosphate-dependent enzyme [candidate division Zixibacteria bacterium]
MAKMSYQIARNIELVRQKIAKRCQSLGQDTAGITIVGITKTYPPQAAFEAIKAGLTDLGENRIQEAAEKIPQVQPRPIWHLVGHLQKNKVKKAVELFDCIQSVDSVELAGSISEKAGAMGKKMIIFLQVNSSGETQKSGFEPTEITKVIDELKSLPNLAISGLMTIGPLTEDTRQIEKSFAMTRNLFEQIQKMTGCGFNKLSMGMSGDYELALDYGANVLRIGTAIFGERRIDK